jgi:hypothetical protein
MSQDMGNDLVRGTWLPQLAGCLVCVPA